MTVVAKVKYELVQGGVMRRLGKDELHEDDLVPLRRRADVLFVGQAHAPAGTPVAAMPVRLALFSEERALLDKRLIVSSDRTQTDESAPAASPFVAMPIRWERALGGEGFEQNPQGIGASPTAEGHVQMPNVFYRDAAWRHRPASFAPIDKDAPMRRRLVAAGHETVLQQAIPDLSAGVHDAYFQAASPDQQVELLRGDETLLMEGLSQKHPVLQSRLPGEAGVAMAYLPPTGCSAVQMQADSLLIDGEKGHCTVTWRGCLTAADEAMLRELLIVVTLSSEKQPVAWPKPDVVAGVVEMLEKVNAEQTTTETMPLSATRGHAAGSGPVTPFVKRASGPPSAQRDGGSSGVPDGANAPIPGAPWGGTQKPAPPANSRFVETVELEAPQDEHSIGESGFEIGMPQSSMVEIDPIPESPASVAAPKATGSDPWGQAEPWARGAAPGKAPPPEVVEAKKPHKPTARELMYRKFR